MKMPPLPQFDPGKMKHPSSLSGNNLKGLKKGKLVY